MSTIIKTQGQMVDYKSPYCHLIKGKDQQKENRIPQAEGRRTHFRNVQRELQSTGKEWTKGQATH